MGLASAPREDQQMSDSPSAGVPLPWDYNADAVADYWAQRLVSYHSIPLPYTNDTWSRESMLYSLK